MFIFGTLAETYRELTILSHMIYHTLSEIIPLRTFNLGNRAIKVL